MKKIYLFIGKLTTGGAERVVSNLSLALSEDLEKKIILFGDEDKIDYPYSAELHYLDRDTTKSFFSKVKSFISRIKKIYQIKNKDDNTVVLSFLEYPNLINLLSSRKAKTIVSVRNHMSRKHQKGIKAYFWRKSISLLYPKADKVVVVSDEIKNDLIENFKIPSNKIQVIYNSYNINKINSLSSEKLESEYEEIFENPVVITVGRIDTQKGHWHLVRAFSNVKKSIPDAKLVILGEGRLEDYVLELATGYGIEMDVHLLGFQKNPFKFLARSKVFVMTSLYEGFPNALAEAMACGIPVISTDCLSGPREILAPNETHINDIGYEISDKRFGILVPELDGNQYRNIDPLTSTEEQLSNFIYELLSNENKRKYFCEKSSERIVQFKISNIIHEWEQIIREL